MQFIQKPPRILGFLALLPQARVPFIFVVICLSTPFYT